MTARRRRPPPAVSRAQLPHPVCPACDRPALFVRRVRGMGRGVFAGRPFKKGEVIEVCPVVPIPKGMARKCKGELLDRYLFYWGERGYAAAVVLGLGSIYNSSPEPNARFDQRWTTREMVFRATRDIPAGAQIFVDYEWKDGEFDLPPAARSRQSRRAYGGRLKASSASSASRPR